MVGEGIWQVKILIFGRVQGVFFRSNAKLQADKLGITGWIRNLPNGAVEITAQGSREDLEKLISWCRRGSLFAKIERVKINWIKPKEFFSSFGIIY